MPERIQLRRSRGWRMPPNTVKVDRTTRWGNPYRVGDGHPYAPDDKMSAQDAKDLFALATAQGRMLTQDSGEGWLQTLRGKNLACWCKPGEPCHADVLLELANQ